MSTLYSAALFLLLFPFGAHLSLAPKVDRGQFSPGSGCGLPGSTIRTVIPDDVKTLKMAGSESLRRYEARLAADADVKCAFHGTGGVESKFGTAGFGTYIVSPGEGTE